VVNRQRCETLLDFGYRTQRHGTAAATGKADIIQRRQPRRLRGVVFQHHAILIRLGIDRGNKTLTEGVVQGIVHIGHADTKAAGAVAIHIDIRHQPLILPVTADISELWQCLQFVHQLWHPFAQGRQEFACRVN
jgi:hypothetical protein